MAKVIFALLDGLNFAAAQRRMCYMSALVDAGRASVFRLHSQMPPLSRPCYATLITGLQPMQHGILRNEDCRQAPEPNLFSQLAQARFCVCAAAWAWFFELSQGIPFDRARHRFWHSNAGPIHNGVFYASDAYPDAELFADAEGLRKKYAPDFLLAHSMGIDRAGHEHGGNSDEYNMAASAADSLLAQYMPVWLAEGYSIIIASDHGMDDDGSHYSKSGAVLHTPLWLAGAKWPQVKQVKQTDICRLIANMFGLNSSGPAPS